MNARTHDLLDVAATGGSWLIIVASKSGAHSRNSQVLIGLTQARNMGA
jgi:hypothetical protein